MTKIFRQTELKADPREVFEFVAQPKNILRIWPKELDVKYVSGPEAPEAGAEFSFRHTMYGQRFSWRSKIISFSPIHGFTEQAIESPFKKWTHHHRFKSSNNRTIVEDEIEMKTSLGPIGDLFARKFIEGMVDYRSLALRKAFGENVEPVYKDTLRIGLIPGTLLSIVAVILSIFLVSILPVGNVPLVLFLGIISWGLLWFFTHDLAHLSVGLPVGVKFIHYYLGISNIVRIKWLIPNSLKLAIFALGLRIDRKESHASKAGFAAMYLAGPLASMLTPFIVPILLIQREPGTFPGLILLVASLANVGVTIFFSPKAGCIYKARRVLVKKEV